MTDAEAEFLARSFGIKAKNRRMLHEHLAAIKKYVDSGEIDFQFRKNYTLDINRV